MVAIHNVTINLNQVDKEELLFEIACDYHDEGDFEAALLLFKMLAERDVAVAQNNLGVMYADGMGVEQDFDQALDWYLKAYEGGEENAFKNIKMIARAGHADTQLALGEICLENFNQDHDLDDAQESVKWFRRAAKQGHAEAKHILGALHLSGGIVPQNFNKAMELFSQAAQDEDVKPVVIAFLQEKFPHDVLSMLRKNQKAKIDFLLASLGASADTPTPEASTAPAPTSDPAPR